MIASNPHTHSAQVSASVRVGDHDFNLAQLGDEYFILRDAVPMEPANAELRLSIDGVEDRQQIFLERGIDPAIVRTVYSRVK